ncbi:uncharacterized protein LOC144158179 [Haemaphysalis longicornis]
MRRWCLPFVFLPSSSAVSHKPLDSGGGLGHPDDPKLHFRIGAEQSGLPLHHVRYNIFATHGFPLQLCTDNGPPFTSQQFRDFIVSSATTHGKVDQEPAARSCHPPPATGHTTSRREAGSDCNRSARNNGPSTTEAPSTCQSCTVDPVSQCTTFQQKRGIPLKSSRLLLLHAPTSWKLRTVVSFNAPVNISGQRTSRPHQSARLPTRLFLRLRLRNNRSPNR